MAWIPASKRTAALILLAVISVSLLAVIMVLDGPLRTPAAPDGIVSFEFSGSSENARRIIDSWSADAKRAAMMSLGLDFLFLVAYAASIALACGLAAEALAARGSRLGRWGHRIAWAQWVAAACDVVENLILMLLLRGFSATGLAETARACAAVKFTLVGIGLVYAASGFMLLHTRYRAPVRKGDPAP
jgi:hypothetical protein